MGTEWVVRGRTAVNEMEVKHSFDTTIVALPKLCGVSGVLQWRNDESCTLMSGWIARVDEREDRAHDEGVGSAPPYR